MALNSASARRAGLATRRRRGRPVAPSHTVACCYPRAFTGPWNPGHRVSHRTRHASGDLISHRVRAPPISPRPHGRDDPRLALLLVLLVWPLRRGVGRPAGPGHRSAGTGKGTRTTAAVAARAGRQQTPGTAREADWTEPRSIGLRLAPRDGASDYKPASRL
ncbi:hypothetical protein PVAP13_3KG317054 [Panicum virgatum]|uniref:Uncharacterized protein n=1 Tax=Panicum virgatum TaxID=38727 RepID=A0A8T0UVI4_PANVG|nr:hypothetical protein PVAP13_3KG317054 [Panicum virgatum]